MINCRCSREMNCALYNAYVRDCPCRECLVKASCSQMCEGRQDYWSYMTGEEKEISITRRRDLRKS